ncbi:MULTISPECIES: helix-turn-helix domain-containing protein [Vibrio]|uniref:helix-turn-helix domain-containing protein n=1 Tax=Vibrio TaxID=662 RepID=UPI0034A0B45B
MKTPLYICRANEKLTQNRLAQIVDSSGPTISRLERGETNEVSGRVCLNIIRRYGNLGLTLEHLINPHNYPDFLTSLRKEKQQ